VSEPESSLFLDESSQSLSVLQRHLEAFLKAWDENAAPPNLHRHLPQSPELRRVTLIELIKIDLEYRWQVHRFPKQLGDYLSEFPELAEAGVPADLVYEEFHIRRQAGQPVQPRDYIEQFPEQETELARLLGINNAYETTALYKVTGKDALEHIQPGQRLDDFELLVRLGAGSFAHVYLARQMSMQRLVAVKISADHGSEPQTLAQLDHDHIVRVYDQRSLRERGLRLLYMQYISGGTLQTVVQELKQTPPREQSGSLLVRSVDRVLELRGESRPGDSPLRARLRTADWTDTVCWIGSRLATALDYAHRHGVLHRDIKPANVLVTAEGIPKLADFNISFSSKVQGVTAASYFGGSLAYMSPEQLEASSPAFERQPEDLDGRSDLYSLGVLLWELLTARRPFIDKKVQGGWERTLDAMIERRRNGLSSEALATVPETCPPGLVRVLRTCLAPEPDDRWQSGAELSRQLELCRHPEAERLLVPPEQSWYRRLRPVAIVLVLLLGMLPNIIAGIWNYIYNEQSMIQHLSAASRDAFFRVQLVINAIAYPAGLACVWWRCHPVQRSLRRKKASSEQPSTEQAEQPSTEQAEQPSLEQPESSAAVRKRGLNLGHFVAIVSVVEWTIAGIAYPVCMHFASGSLPSRDYAHFFASLFLCGLIAAAYPFFLVTNFCFRVVYPCQIRNLRDAATDRPVLQRILQRAYPYLAIGALAPMLGVLMALFLPAAESEFQRQALGVFAVMGLLGFAALFVIFRRLQTDLEHVIAAADALEHA